MGITREERRIDREVGQHARAMHAEEVVLTRTERQATRVSELGLRVAGKRALSQQRE
jgi:hypothetical protein